MRRTAAGIACLYWLWRRWCCWGCTAAAGRPGGATTITIANPCVCSGTCRRGVALAKAGDLAGAEGCYAQALQLDAGNADALVARGAAAANQRQWQRASGGAMGDCWLLCSAACCACNAPLCQLRLCLPSDA